MATTDARPGFRLPWSSDQPNPNDESAEATVDSEATARTDDGTTDAVTSSAAPQSVAAEPPAAPAAPAAPKAARKPSKFLADLTRAMQAAAESAREETLGRFQAAAKGHVEDIHARSANEAADLRRRADDDVAAVREWSKAEIARIREETETKIADRKSRLEGEIEDHAARIEREIERVQGHVAEFEGEMARFFERLLGEDDPTRFASMAENLPEPPPFDDALWSQPIATLAAEPTVEQPAPSEAADAPAENADPEAAMVAIQAAFEAAAEREAREVENAAAADEASPDSPAEVQAQVGDPRVSALELADGLAAAEAEAFAAADSTAEVEIPTIADEALAARLAGLVPAAEEGASPDASVSTRVVVNGLVSVASIAGFKRSLARVPGVQSVGVSSGPDGEFVFAVAHASDLDLRDVIPTLASYQARVTGGDDGVVEVTAHDPDSEA